MIRIGLWGGDLPSSDRRAIAARLGDVFLENLEVAEPDAVLSGDALKFDAIEISGDAEQVDVIDIRSSDYAQQVCLQAVRAGIHVVARPALFDPEVLDSIVRASRETNACLLVASDFRFHPSVHAIKQSLGSGKLGEAGLLRLHDWTPANAEVSCLADHIDVACWLMERTADQVYAIEASVGDDHDSDSDYRQLHLGFPGGAMALVDCWRNAPDGDSYFSLSVIGSAGAAYADDHHNAQLLYRGGRPAALIASDSVDVAVARIRTLLDVISGDPQSVSRSIEMACNTLRITAAVAEALERRQAVTV